MSAKLSKFLMPVTAVVALGGLSFLVSRGRDGATPHSAEAAPLRLSGKPVAPLAATVNGQGISLEELKARSLAIAGKGALHQIIDETLIRQALQAKNLAVSNADVARREQEMQRLSGHSIEANLKQNGVGKAEFEANLRNQVGLEKLVTFSPKPALNRRHVWHLTITTFDIDPQTGRAKTRTPAQALQVLANLRQKLASGAKFGDLAARYSDYDATRQSRGDLGILYAGLAYSSNLYQAARSLNPGEFSRQTVQSPAGYELLYVSSTANHHQPLEDGLYAQAAENYRHEQLADAGEAIMNSLRRKAQVSVKQRADAIAATVNGEAISTSTVAERALKIAGTPVLNQLVQSALIDQAAASRHVTALPVDIEIKKTRLASSLHGQPLEVALQNKGLTMAELESELTEQVKLEKLSNVPTQTPTHMRHVYHLAIGARDLGPSSLPGAPTKPSRAEALRKIQEISLRLSMGASFSNLARQYSDDGFTKASGGDLGILHDGSTDNPGIVKVALGLQKGQFSKPFESFFGYDIVYVASTGEDHPASENKLYRDAAAQSIDAQRGEPARRTLEQLRSQAAVNIVYQP